MIQGVTPGRMVHVVLGDGTTERAAIITAAPGLTLDIALSGETATENLEPVDVVPANENDSIVSASIFLAPGDDQNQDLQIADTAHFPIYVHPGLAYSEEKQPWTWHWIERA